MGTYFIGVDCGVKGAIVVLDSKKELVNWLPMPFLNNHSLLPHISPLDTLVLVKYFQLFRGHIQAIGVEVPRSIPNLNKSSNIFRQGANVQVVISSIFAAGVSPKMVLLNEKEWQPKETRGKGKKSYVDHIPFHIQKKITPPRCRTPHEGAIDAYLMACYCLDTPHKMQYYENIELWKEKTRKKRIKKNWKF